ncbi:MAG: hypothetical protein K6G89_08565 [Clostridia bacterium]|nr:hypothetical protein [Clostridia bacterium]
MKKLMKLVPAFIMLLVSAILVSTATFAWFSMNTTVTATGMEVKAVAEKGILINEVATSNSNSWDDEATANDTTPILLRATSTATTASWYTASSKKSNTSASATSGTASSDLVDGYHAVTATAATTAAAGGTNAKRDIYYVERNGNSSYDAGEGYYVMYTYYIKSSAEAITCGLTSGAQNFNIKSVTATPATNTSAALDKALRVAVVVAGKAYIYAPVYDYANSEAAAAYYVNAGSTATTPLNNTVAQPTSLTSIPATTDDGTPVYIYIYFEGEDANLKTDNVTTALDNIDVVVKFALATNAAAVTDNGVTVG